jgi:chemotaxis protein histidine kinase CheA
VEQGKVDLLMNLVGELVVAKNALPFLARDAEMRSTAANSRARSRTSMR